MTDAKKPTIAELEAMLADNSPHRIVINPDGSVRAETVVLVDEKWVIAVNEFLSDWIKGDFDLPKLGAIDAEAILVAGADGKRPVLIGKTLPDLGPLTYRDLLREGLHQVSYVIFNNGYHYFEGGGAGNRPIDAWVKAAKEALGDRPDEI